MKYYVLCFSFIVGLYCLGTSAFFQIQRVHIFYALPSQAKELYWTDLLERLQDKWKYLEGHNIWTVNTFYIKKELAKEAWIKAFHIQRKWPSHLEISIEPKKVIAIEVSRQANVIPLADDGVFLESTSLTRGPVAPILRMSKSNQETKEKLIYILSHLPKEGQLALKHIDEVSVESGQVWIHLLKEKIKIKLGSENMVFQVARVEKVLKYLKSQNITDRIIDADFSWKVLVSPYDH